MTWKNFRRNAAKFLLAAFLWGGLSGAARGAEGDARLLSLAECMSIAEANHPSVTGAAAQVSGQKGRLEQVLAADRPEVSGSASLTRTGTGDIERSSSSLGVTASLKIFDSNRNKYTADAQRITLSATEEEERKTLMDVRSNVKSSYMTLLLNAEITEQKLESVRSFEHHLEQAQAFYEVGTKPWYDVTKAKVDLGNAQLALVEAESNAEIAKASLRNAMGIDQKEAFDIEPLSFDEASLWSAALEEMERLALENRPDYRASGLKTLAGGASLRAEARASSPSASLTAGYSGAGEEISDLEKSWNVGLRVSVPILDGGSGKARVETARAQLTSLEASQEKLRQDIMLEVRRAFNDLSQARERIRISELTLASADENRKMAIGRYETGVGSSLEVTDALLSYTSALLANRQALYDLRLSMVGLEQAVGQELLSY